MTNSLIKMSLTALLLSAAMPAYAQNNATTPTPGAGAASAAAPNQTVQVNSQQSPPQSAAQAQAGATPVAPDGLRPEPGLYSKQCVCKAMYPPGQDAPPQKKKNGHHIIKGLGKEMGMEMGDLGKDMFLAFSVSGADPYEMPEHPDIPYIEAEAQFVDGSSSNILKYPDGSVRISGGFLDGTFACKQSDGLFIVQYPNGARGTMKMTGTGCEVIRPDNTLTTITRSGGGAFRVVNSKLGYMGDITPDKTGLSYEFAKQNF